MFHSLTEDSNKSLLALAQLQKRILCLSWNGHGVKLVPPFEKSVEHPSVRNTEPSPQAFESNQSELPGELLL